MTYSNVAKVAQDIQLRNRIVACIATQSGYQVPDGVQNHPIAIAEHYRWQLAGQPGWGDAYGYAIATDVEEPGNNEAVITDAMILSAGQLVLGIE